MNKQEAIEYIQEWLKDKYALNGKDRVVLNMAIEALSAERTGEWTEREDWNGDNYYDCSVCGESFVLIDGTPSMNLYHYCPNCGAKMVGNNDEK